MLDQESANSEIVFGGVNQKTLRGMPYMAQCYPADGNDDYQNDGYDDDYEEEVGDGFGYWDFKLDGVRWG
jgi:hypothetical protein